MNAFKIFFFLQATLVSGVTAAEVQIDENGNNVESVDANRYFDFATNNKPWSILEEIFPNAANSIDKYWGKHPVYLPRSADLEASSSSSLQRIVPDRSKSRNRFSHLFQIDDSLAVLQNNPQLVHGRDYYVLKYILKDGEEWNGQLPTQSVPAHELPALLNQHAFSLVINNIQKYWGPVKDFARSLELETLIPTTCNLYLTPPKKARAFESHTDWQDVIVLQLEGEKMWSVAPDPMIHLVLPDQKRKPTKEEIQSTLFQDVLLRPGDALYIPRGHLHNATTTSGGGRHSLHLTFGIEYEFESTFEALLHNSVQLYEDEYDNKYTQQTAIPSQMCDKGHKLTWIKLLHYSISELARQTDCGGYGEYGKTSKDNDMICSMRESVPLHSQFRELPHQTDEDTELKFKGILNAILNQVNALDALNFMNSQTRLGEVKLFELGSSDFKYTGMTDELFGCKPKTESLGLIQETLESLTEDFTSFAMNRFHHSRERIIERNQSSRMARWKHSDEHMNVV